MLQTAKELIANYKVVDKDNIVRHAKNEFQAYAYRLAHDLNDLVNLRIYMRLAKNVDRHLMEQAYSFVLDSTSKDKGRLFLWKLRKIREELEKNKDMVNFSYEHVIKKMSKVRDIFVDDILNSNLSKINIEKINTGKALLIGISYELVSQLTTAGYSLTALDISGSITKKAKTKSKSKKLKIIKKEFLQKEFDSAIFDLIVVNNFWQNIPKETESKYLQKIKKVLKPDGKVIFLNRYSAEDSQEWKSKMIKEADTLYFIKKINKENFEKLIKNIFENNEYIL